MKTTHLVLGLFLVVITACQTNYVGGGGSRANRDASSSKIYFENAKYDKVLEMALEEQKPVFLDFYTDWCAPCLWLERDAFQDEAAAKYFNENLINLKVNAEKGEGIKLAQKFNIQAYPTVIYIKPNGKEHSRHVGMATASKLISMAKTVVEEVSNE